MDWHNRQTWEFINSFSDWFSAVGTILAVVVSLYLARKGNKIELEVKALQGTLILAEGTNSQECVWVEVVNVGRRTLVVNLVFWRAGIFQRQDFFWRIPINERSSKFPTQLHDGEHARWVMDIQEFNASMEPVLEAIPADWLLPVRLWFLKVGVRTSTGEFFKKRVQKSLREYLLELIRERGKNSD